MAITITSDLALVTSADTITSQGTWARVNGTSSGNPAVEGDGKVEGLGCLVAKAGATIGTTDVGLQVVLTAAFDGTGKHIFHWRNNSTPSNMLTKSAAGTSFHLSSEATFGVVNYKRWYLDGGDTDIIGGWRCYVIDPSSAGSISAGTPALTAVKTLAYLHRQSTAVTTSLNNVSVDATRVGTGLTANASSAADTVNFAGLYATDSLNANAWGVVTQNAGIYYGAAKVSVGSILQTNTCLFKDTNAVLVWREYPVANSLYAFKLAGAVLSKTTFQLGDKDGSNNTSNGCVVRGQGAAVWNIVCDANSGFKAYASSLSRCLSATLSATSELRDTAVSTGGTIDVNGATLAKCTFSGHTATQLKVDAAAEMDTISSCVFSSGGTGHAIEITAPGTYTFSGLTFNNYAATNGSTGNEAVFVNVLVSNTVTINISGGGNIPSVRTAGATVPVIASAAVTVSGLVTGTRVKATKVSDGTVLFNGVESTGSVNFSTDYAGAVAIEARKGTSAPYYQPWVTQITTVIGQTSSVTALQQLDQ